MTVADAVNYTQIRTIEQAARYCSPLALRHRHIRALIWDDPQLSSLITGYRRASLPGEQAQLAQLWEHAIDTRIEEHAA